MKYLTFNEYQEMGGILDLTAFEKFITRASGYIDFYTDNRIEKMTAIPGNAKECCKNLVEYMDKSEKARENSIASKSQSAGSVSESVAYNVKSADEIKAEIYEIIFEFLISVKDDNGICVLYRGYTA